MTRRSDQRTILLAAYGVPGIWAVEKLFALGLLPEQIAVITHAPDPRNHSLWAFCQGQGIEVNDDFISSEVAAKRIARQRPEALFSLHFRDRIPPHILAIPACGGVNLHPSLLPDYRGCFSVPWAIIHGEKQTGFSYHYMTAEFDQGNILLQEQVPILETDTAFSLFHKLIVTGLEVFETVYKLVVIKRHPGRPQGEGGRYFPRKVPFDGYIDPSWTEEKVDRFIRAMRFPPLQGAMLKTQEGEVEITSLEEYRCRTPPGKDLPVERGCDA